MNLNSFRLKITLLSGLITGLLLVGSGLVLWRISYQFNLNRLDREIRNLGQANLDRVQGGDHWARLEEALKFVAGKRQSGSFMLWVKNYEKVIYQSPSWPTNVLPASFAGSDQYEGPNAPKPGESPPPPRRTEPISSRNPALPLKSPRFSTCTAAGQSWRVGVMGNPYVTLILAANLDDFDSRMAELRNTYLTTLVVVLGLVAGGAWLVARRALRPVTALTQIAERVTARGLDQRIPAEIHVQADAELLEQALQNLASNAIKYNCGDGMVRFELLPEANQVLIRVANTGRGIPPADRARIFERFYRADKSRNGRVEGTGLGLSLAREIVRAHQGELVLEPAQESWTTFTIRLPVMIGDLQRNESSR